MKKLLVLLLFFIPFGLFAQESVTRSEDGKSLIVQPKKHVAFFDADSVRISMKMFNDSLATLKYIISSRNVEDTTAFLLTRKIPKNYRECIGEKLPDLEIEDLAGNKLMVGENKNISLIVFWSIYCSPCIKELKILDALSEEYPETDIFAITGNSRDTVRSFMQKHNFKWENIHLIPDCSYEEKYPIFSDIQVIPFSVIVDRNLVIKDIFVAEGMRRMLTVLDSLNEEYE
ncbi:MAG TPA: TlpA family protein disulfide reductase [Coprobacter fastidiosus]|uniref:TlpA family protein disulfide reductase n=2 Tax=Coprobacter fastidiosus TaxID=1099853 RepID=A0A354LZC0_9BACT|nr:TlpA family protein disulfide reductase [Coprobacter fastidiosus]